MGIFDGPGIADTLARLLNGPAQTLGRSLRGTAQQFGAGPLRTPSRSSLGSSPRQKDPLMAEPFGFGMGTILGDIGARLAKTQGQQQQGSGDPLIDLYDQLVNQLQSPVKMPTGINTEDLMKQIRNAIDPIYDQRAEAAENRTGRATGQVKDMYGALAEDYKKLAPQQLAQSKAAQEEIKQLYGQLRSNIEGNYTRVADEQSELFQQLGIEDALPEVLDQQDDAVLEAQTAASENQAQQQQRYMDIGQMDATYYREGSPNALMTGNEISTDMLSQLQEYLNQNDAERTSGIQTAYMDQYSQAQSQLAQQQQVAQQEAGRKQEMLWQMLQSQMQGGQQQQALTPDTFMAQLPPNVQQGVAGAFTRLQRSPEAVYGKVEDKRNPVPGTFVETTPQWYMAQADEMLKRGEIDPTTYQALQMFLQLNYGSK